MAKMGKDGKYFFSLNPAIHKTFLTVFNFKCCLLFLHLAHRQKGREQGRGSSLHRVSHGCSPGDSQVPVGDQLVAKWVCCPNLPTTRSPETLLSPQDATASPQTSSPSGRAGCDVGSPSGRRFPSPLHLLLPYEVAIYEKRKPAFPSPQPKRSFQASSEISSSNRLFGGCLQ